MIFDDLLAGTSLFIDLGVASRATNPSVAYQHQMDAFVYSFLAFTDIIGAPSLARGTKELAVAGWSKVTSKLLAKNGGVQAATEEAKQALIADLKALAEAGNEPAKQTLLELKVLVEGSCFVAGTPLLTPNGDRLIERFRKGDHVLSRSQLDVDGPLEAKVVEEVFVRVASVLALVVGGRLIRTTAEHPFYVLGQGWRCARELQAGDWLVSHERIPVQLEQLEETGEVATVYNLRIADYHTYFVGSRAWGFSVWAHNARYEVAEESGKIFLKYGEGELKGQAVKTQLGDVITYATKEEALAKAVEFNALAAPVRPAGYTRMQDYIPHLDNPATAATTRLTPEQAFALQENLQAIANRTVPAVRTNIQGGRAVADATQGLQGQLNLPRFRFIDQVPGGRAAIDAILREFPNLTFPH